MSNRAVSSTYRIIIDDVIANVRQDFEDMGIENEVLVELQRSWEAKTVASGVADFEGAPPGTSAEEVKAARKARQEELAALRQAEEKAKQDAKAEKDSSNKKLKMEGSDANGQGGNDLGPGFVNPSNLMSNNATSSAGTGPDPNSNSNSISSLLNASSGADKEQNAESSKQGAENGNGNGNGTKTGDKRKREENQSDEIGSDLDDDDDEGPANLADIEGEDIGLCLYDKVQRVKNKWKCVLRDGIASVDGRDYLFSKCNGEFEW